MLGFPDILNQYPGPGGGGAGQYQQFCPVDKRTERERLIEKRTNNEKAIELMQAQNREINEAISILNEHPMIEKLNNLLRRLL